MVASPSDRFSAVADKDKRRDGRRDSAKERRDGKKANGSDNHSKERSGARPGRGTRQRSPNGLRRSFPEPPGLERKGRQAPTPGAVPPTVAPSVRAIPDRLRKQVREIVWEAGADGIVLSALQDRLKLDYAAFGFTRLAQMVEAMGVCSISKSSGKVSQPVLYIKGAPLEKGGHTGRPQTRPNGKIENTVSASYEMAVERFLARVQTAKQAEDAKLEVGVTACDGQRGEVPTSSFSPGEYIATLHWEQEVPECTTLPVYTGLRLYVSWMDEKGHWAYARTLPDTAESESGYVPQSAIIPAPRPVFTRTPDERVRLTSNWSPSNSSSSDDTRACDACGDDGGSPYGCDFSLETPSAWLPGTCAMTELVVVETSPCGQLVYCQAPDSGIRGWVPEALLG